MTKRRVQRLNSLLKEVISEVILREVRNPEVSPLVTITNVKITEDLTQAKVFVSVIGTEADKEKTLNALQSAAGFIGICSAKKVVMRHFPTLTFKIDNSVDHQMKIEKILNEIHNQEKS
jgi:ribosome-binding factor A